MEKSLDIIFHALSDSTRRKMIELLRESGELCVGDLAKVFDMSLNGVSKHLKVLEKANLIKRRVSGRTHYLSVNWSALQQGYEWIHFFQNFWNKRIDRLIDYISLNHKGEKDD